MKSNIISKSERSSTNVTIIFIGIILFSFFMFLLNTNFQPKNNYEENLKIISFFVLTSITLYCLYYYLNHKRIYVYEKHFEIKKLFQIKKYHYSDIATYFSKDFEGKYNSWVEYYLVLNTGEKLKLIDSEYSNFSKFFFEIKARVKRDKSLNAKLSKPKFLQYSIICGIITCVIIFLSSLFYDFKKTENNDLAYITSRLNKEVSLVRGRKGKSDHLKLQLINQPNFEFKISGSSYDGIIDYDQFLNTYKEGSIITIGIEREAFEKKISKKKDINFLDKYIFRFSTIQVAQVRDAQNKYLIDLAEVNKLKTRNNYTGIGILSIFGILFFYLCVGNFTAHIKSSQMRNKTTHNPG